MKKSLILHTIGHAGLVLAYISGVALLMFNGKHLFPSEDNFLMPVAMLFLFVLSATIVGALVLGRPILLYVDGAKTDAIKFFAFTVGWLFCITLALFVSLSIRL